MNFLFREPNGPFEEGLREFTDTNCDVNFKTPDWKGVARFFELIEMSFDIVSASDCNGNEVGKPFAKHASKVGLNNFVLVECWDGKDLVTRLQIFLEVEEDGSPFIELTFFPGGIAQNDNFRQRFVDWIDRIGSALRAETIFVRHENGAWDFGDTSRYSGVLIHATRQEHL